MKPRFKIWCRLLLAVGVLALSADARVPSPIGQQPSADEIVTRAVDRAERQRVTNAALAFTATLHVRNERLNGDNEIEESETETFKQYPFEGALFNELVTRNGEPLDERELEDEAERKVEFAENVRERRAEGDAPRSDDPYHVEFDYDFVDRYQFSIVGEDVVNGHPSWVIYLSPREGDLPVRRDIDHALNNSTGHLWISMDDYGLVRVEFEMARSVRFWLGLLGTLRNTKGRVDFERIADGVWIRTLEDITTDQRMFFRNARRRLVREYRDYTPIPGR